MCPLSGGNTSSKRQRNAGKYLKGAGCSRLRRLVCQARLCRLPRAGEGVIFQGPLSSCIAAVALLGCAPKLCSQGCRGRCLRWIQPRRGYSGVHTMEVMGAMRACLQSPLTPAASLLFASVRPLQSRELRWEDT